MPKVKVTIAEKVFRTYEVELDIPDDQDPDEMPVDFEDWFISLDEDGCIQDDVVDRDFELNCAKCKSIHSPGSTDNLSVYCEDCQKELAEAKEGIHAGEGI
jgi:hypothetical protein